MYAVPITNVTMREEGARAEPTMTKTKILIVEDEFITATDIQNNLKGMGTRSPPSSIPVKRPSGWPGNCTPPSSSWTSPSRGR